MSYPEVVSMKNPLKVIPDGDPPEGWLTVVRCPECKHYMRSNGHAQWCEVCGHGKDEAVSKRGQDWSAEEDAYLKENYGSQSAETLMKNLPGRSWESIKVRAYRVTDKRVKKL